MKCTPGDPGVTQPRHGLCLAVEPRPVGFAIQRRPENLERDDAVQRDLAGLVDNPHPTRPDAAFDPEIADLDARF